MKKNLSLIVALTLLVGATTNAIAKEEPRNAGLAVVPVKGSEVFKVIYKTESVSKIKLNIYNASSKLIFSESQNSDGFIRPLNFTGLSAGEYTIEITDGTTKRTEKINYIPAKTLASSKKIVHISKITGADEKFLVSLAQVPAENVTINFYDESDRLLHSETRKVTGDFAQLYFIKNHKVASVEVVDEAGNKKATRF